MAGHSHAKNVKIRKGAVDAKRSQLFTKLARLVTVAARNGGDPKTNTKLAFAISKARAASVPKDTIEKAVRKGTGEDNDGANYDEIIYEGYGPGGVAVIVNILTDNRNRTAGEVRKIFEVCGGKMGSTGCVAYLFQRRGQFLLDAEGKSEDALMEMLLEAGADDLRRSGDTFEVLCDPSMFEQVSNALSGHGLQPLQADVVQLADTLVACDEDNGRLVAKLLDRLDEHDDVQSVFSNADLPESILNEG